MTDALPTLTDADVTRIEAKELETALAKVNAGATLTKHERELVKRAHERGRHAPAAAAPSFSPTSQELSLDDVSHELPAELVAHSARYLKQRNPRLYNAILLGLEWAIPKIVLAERLGVSRNLIRAVEAQESTALDQGKKVLIESVRRFVHGAWERLGEEVDAMKLENLAIAAGIGTEKLLLLSGEATQRVEHTRKLTPEEQALQDLMQQFTGACGMGLNSGNPSAMPALPDPSERVDGGSVALSNPLIVRDLRESEALVMPKDTENPSNFNQGGGGGHAAEPPNSL